MLDPCSSELDFGRRNTRDIHIHILGTVTSMQHAQEKEKQFCCTAHVKLYRHICWHLHSPTQRDRMTLCTCRYIYCISLSLYIYIYYMSMCPCMYIHMPSCFSTLHLGTVSKNGTECRHSSGLNIIEPQKLAVFSLTSCPKTCTQTQIQAPIRLAMYLTAALFTSPRNKLQKRIVLP